MDPAQLQGLIAAGESLQFTKYFIQGLLAIVIWDHLITLSDEVEYVWKKEKSWPFWLFIVSRYSVLLFKIWVTISAASFHIGKTWSSAFTNTFAALFWSGYTQEPDGMQTCNRTAKLEGYYFVFILALGLIFLTMRVYAVTEANKYVIVISGILVTSSLATGLWFVSIPSARAVQMPEIPLDPFRACILTAPDANEWAYRSQVALADVVAFVCLVAFIFKLKADQGQSRMTHLMRTVLQDGILYFFVMAGFHIAMLFFTIVGKPSALPPIAIIVIMPVMISRLVVSLRKTLDASLVQVWDGDRLTTAESSVHEMINFAGPSLSQTSFSTIPYRNSKRSSHLPSLLSEV